MVLLEDQLFKRHSDLCNQLNLEQEIVSASWESFQVIYKKYSLEGDLLNWLGCAIFVACQNTETTTIEQSVLRGNCVNFTSLLRHSNLSFAQFFCNITKWIDMSKLSDDFKEKIKHLKDTFGVAYNTFKEFHPLFSKIFYTPDPQELDPSKQHRNRKQKPICCNSSKLFEFAWTFFITIKGEDPEYSTELVKSYHLLYACLDLLFKNAFLADRRDLLNPQFSGLPDDWTNPCFEMPSDAPCIIKQLCKCDATYTDAMLIKVHIFKKYILDLFNNKTLNGDAKSFTGVLDPQNFEANMKSISKAYEAQLLKYGGFDEKIFLAEYRRQLLVQQNLNCSSVYSESAEMAPLESPRMQPQGLQTPLTFRRFLATNEPEASSLSRSQNISWLNNILNGRLPEPSEKLLQLFEFCTTNPIEKIKDIVNTMTSLYEQACLEQAANFEETMGKLQKGITLFYKFIENILTNEKNLSSGDISQLVEKDLFYQCTLACSLEIVLFSYDSPNKFPWILQVLKIQPFHFVKVIELIVRSRESLSRNTIKHLSRIEETILESLVWSSDSELWNILKSVDEIPKFQETARPDQIIYNETLKKNQTESASNPLTSPTSASEVFQSPVSNNTSVNRQLFPNVQVQPGQSVLQKHTHIMITDNEGNRLKLIPILEPEKQKEQSPVKQNEPSTPSVPIVPRKTGSLAIFFRKIYNLAGERLDHLYNKLQLNNTDLKPKIWTIFEDSLIHHTHLMKDRHLDQMIMCAVYVISKVCKTQIKFADVMRCYRDQPQADSNIYRHVLLKPSRTEIIEGETVEIEEERGDLINFYNNTYVNEMKNQALKFASNNPNTDFLLSPLPAVRRPAVTTGVQLVGNFFIKTLESPSSAATNGGYQHHYIFNRSPSKDLKNINHVINGITGKRLWTEGDQEMPSAKRPSSYKKIQSLVQERKSQNTL